MALEQRPARLSYADFLKLPPEMPGELINGELTMPPSPIFQHQAIADRIMRHLGAYLDEHPEVGVACSAPMDVVLRAESPAIVVQPDVLFVSAAREGLIDRVVLGAPDLVVEVVSASTVRMDAVRKRELYAEYGVEEYWLVWPEDERVDVFRGIKDGQYLSPKALAAGESLVSMLLPGFELAIDRIFVRRGIPGSRVS
jgi:Uma2 family endonuclease